MATSIAMRSSAAAMHELPAAQRHLRVVRFGHQEPLEVASADLIMFPYGLVGMPELRQFVVIEDERTFPCRWLQSVEEPALAFVVVDPVLILSDYVADMNGADAIQLDLTDPEDADVWAIVTVQADPSLSTVNLLAPIVINRRSRLGKQIVLSEGRYDLRHPLVSKASTAGVAAR